MNKLKLILIVLLFPIVAIGQTDSTIANEQSHFFNTTRIAHGSDSTIELGFWRHHLTGGDTIKYKMVFSPDEEYATTYTIYGYAIRRIGRLSDKYFDKKWQIIGDKNVMYAYAYEWTEKPKTSHPEWTIDTHGNNLGIDPAWLSKHHKVRLVIK